MHDSYSGHRRSSLPGFAMLIKRPSDILPSEITPPEIYARRREFMKLAAAGSILGADRGLARVRTARAQTRRLSGCRSSRTSRRAHLAPTRSRPTTSTSRRYNNYYEFGTEKEEPARYAKALKVRPWSVVVEGEVDEAAHVRDRGAAQVPARGADLSPALRRGVVDGDPVDRVRVQPHREARRADLEGEVRRVRHRATSRRR